MGGVGGGSDIGRGHRYYYDGDVNRLQIVTSKIYTTSNHPYATRSLPPPPRYLADPLPPSFYSKYDLNRDRKDGGKVTVRGSAWCLSDPEMRRRKRVAGYKAYSVEGKLKDKIRRGFRWIKNRCRELVHGY